MAKRSLLDLTQGVLVHIGSDSVNSITDTQEATDVARIIRDVYFELIDGADYAHLRTMVTFNSSGDVAIPTTMSLADDIQKIDNRTISYDARAEVGDDPSYKKIGYLEPDAFLDQVLPRGLNLSDSNIQEVTDPVKFYILNDTPPTWCTSFNDEDLIFDSFDSDVDTTLQTSKVQVLGYKEPLFTLTDTFVPDLPSRQFSQLLAEAKSVAMLSIAQVVDPKQEQLALRFRRRYEVEKWRTRHGTIQYRFGRSNPAFRRRTR